MVVGDNSVINRAGFNLNRAMFRKKYGSLCILYMNIVTVSSNQLAHLHSDTKTVIIATAKLEFEYNWRQAHKMAFVIVLGLLLK